MSRRCRVITIATANASVIANDAPMPKSPPVSGPPTMKATPSTATPIATAERRVIDSPSASHASSAAAIGATACMNRTFATVAWLSATMNVPDATAVQPATASPAMPIERNASTGRPRLVTTTNAASATRANRARPATCVAVSTVSSRWSTPAVDHATAARTM